MRLGVDNAHVDASCFHKPGHDDSWVVLGLDTILLLPGPLLRAYLILRLGVTPILPLAW